MKTQKPLSFLFEANGQNNRFLNLTTLIPSRNEVLVIDILAFLSYALIDF